MRETERLVPRRWHVDDAAFVRRLWSERDDRVPAHRRLDAAGHPDVAEIAARIRARTDPPPAGRWILRLRATGEDVGWCGLVVTDDGPPEEPELAFELLQAHRGHGYATEAGEALLAHARASGLTAVRATVRAWNTPSRRVLATLGFTETGQVEPDAAHGDSLHLRREC